MAALRYPVTGAPRIAEIIEMTSEVMRVPVDVILGRSKFTEPMMARAVIAVIANGYNYSSSQIARALGRDRSTVSSNISRRMSEAMPIVEAVLDALDGQPRPSLIEPSPDALLLLQRRAGIPTTAAMKRPQRVAPFPPAAEPMIRRGVSLKTLREMWPEWRV